MFLQHQVKNSDFVLLFEIVSTWVIKETTDVHIFTLSPSESATPAASLFQVFFWTSCLPVCSTGDVHTLLVRPLYLHLHLLSFWCSHSWSCPSSFLPQRTSTLPSLFPSLSSPQSFCLYNKTGTWVRDMVRTQGSSGPEMESRTVMSSYVCLDQSSGFVIQCWGSRGRDVFCFCFCLYCPE